MGLSLADGAPVGKQIRLDGRGIGWGDWLFASSQIKKPGVSDPTFVNWLGDQYGQQFAEGNVGTVDGAQSEHKFLVGAAVSGQTNLYGQPHLHLILHNAPGGVGETMDWTVKLCVGGIGQVMAEATLTGTYTFDGTESQYQHIIVPMDQTIDTSSWTISTAGSASIKYETTGDYNTAVIFHSFDIHLPIDAPAGSDEATSKTAV